MTPDAPRPDLNEAERLDHDERLNDALRQSRAAHERWVRRHTPPSVLAELDRLRAIEQRAREVAETGCVDGGYSWPARYAARHILGEA